MELIINDSADRSQRTSIQESALANTLLMRACEFLIDTQKYDGSWREPPDPRILENALVVLGGRLVPDLRAITAAAEAWVLRAVPQSHHPIPAAIDSWLIEMVKGHCTPLDLTHPTFQDPSFQQRTLFFNALAIVFGAPVLGGSQRDTLEAKLTTKLVARKVVQQKAWSGAEIASLWLLLAGNRRAANDRMVEEAFLAIDEAQQANGSIAHNPLSTLLAIFALHQCFPESETLVRAKQYLSDAQQPDGTWRFSLTDVWDTALVTRIF
jgi:squalene-hopene/tetraprenyl-beta-curcumene cyclase